MTGHTCKLSSGEVETGRSVCSLASQPSLFSSRPLKDCVLRVRSGYMLVIEHLTITYESMGSIIRANKVKMVDDA